MEFPGVAHVQLYSAGILVFQSNASGMGFIGIIGTTFFDEARVFDPADGAVYIDDIHFGAPVPAPAALGVLACLAVLPRSRRR